jgi:UDP-glucuronate 4-epimerase
MQSVVVTGARGFIGSHLVDALSKRGDRVTAIDDGSNARHDPPIDVRPLDVRDGESIARAIAEAAPTIVFHLAAISGVRPSFDRAPEYVSRNALGTANVLRASHLANVRTVVITSSSSVYGNRRDERAFREDDPLEAPESPYAASKRAAEDLAGLLSVPYGLRVATTRLFTVYGPRQRPDLAIAQFLRAAKRDEELLLYATTPTSTTPSPDSSQPPRTPIRASPACGSGTSRAIVPSDCSISSRRSAGSSAAR